MATTPMKSQQPLHNFSLPFLKWGQRTILTSNISTEKSPRRCRPQSEASAPSPQHRQSENSGSDSENCCDPVNPSPPPSISKESVSEGEANDGAAAKAWNLRPRRGVNEAAMTVGSGGGTKSGRLRGGVTTMNDKRENARLWISLSKEEIEEDVYALTGSRPNRRPKKRPKSVQKKLDNLFPGLSMVGYTADTYRVHESPADNQENEMIPHDLFGGNPSRADEAQITNPMPIVTFEEECESMDSNDVIDPIPQNPDTSQCIYPVKFPAYTTQLVPFSLPFWSGPSLNPSPSLSPSPSPSLSSSPNSNLSLKLGPVGNMLSLLILHQVVQAFTPLGCIDSKKINRNVYIFTTYYFLSFKL